MAEKCKECGCKCSSCTQDDLDHCDMHLHVEIENLRQRLQERDNHIVTMETQFLSEADKFPNGELASIKEEISMWQEKYSRLFEAHRRVQRVNQNLEDKLLKIVDKCETEKGAFTKDIATLSHRLADANFTIHRLTQDNEKYRNDVNLAIQLLQCKPSNFIGQKYESLPPEVQAKVKSYISQKNQSNESVTPEVKSITVPISTFPPTAMVYSVTKPNIEKHEDDDVDESKPPVDIVSAAIMAKVLEDREKERIFAKHCDTCTCHRSILLVDAETQTMTLPDFSFSESSNTKSIQSAGRYSDVYKNGENLTYGKQSQHTTLNENTMHNAKQFCYNSNYALCTNSQSLCVKDKLASKYERTSEGSKEPNKLLTGQMSNNIIGNFNKKPNQIIISHNQNQCMTNPVSFQNVNDTSSTRINVEKIKQGRISNKLETRHDSKTSSDGWDLTDKHSQDVSKNLSTNLKRQEQTQLDIINERLWKNKWSSMKPDTNMREMQYEKRVSSDIEIDVINSRDWKNGKSRSETQNPTFTVIEVKNIDSSASQQESGQTEIATSPSFSSDSVVISTSDPSSSSSDVIQPMKSSPLAFNSTVNSKTHRQNRITGPRNCLVRVTPGSNNILLDNAGQYNTVLYTSSGNKPNTALVHTKKISRSDSARSASTSSEENSPVLLQDNNQLQRVAEWVQSSARVDDTPKNDNRRITEVNENSINNWQSSSLIYTNDPKSHCKSYDYRANAYYDIHGKERDSLRENADVSKETTSRMDVITSAISSENDHTTQEKEKDLIIFDWPPETEEKERTTRKPKNEDFNYEVKITKEMEETYLKLAASIDPVALLPSTEGADLTIERYRKDHKMSAHSKTTR